MDIQIIIILSIFGATALILLLVSGWWFCRRYILLPLKIRRNLRPPIKPRFFDFELDQFPGLSDRFKDIANDLASLGFLALGHLKHTSEQGAEVFYSVWVQPANKDIATAVATRTRRERDGEYRVKFFVYFQQNYVGGAMISTSNRASQYGLIASEQINRLCCPGTWHLPSLYAVHRARIEHFGHGRESIVPSDIRAFQADEHTRGVEDHFKKGFLRVIDDTYYGYTLKGAYLTVWRGLWPLKQIGARRESKKTDRELKQLGFVDLPTLNRSQMWKESAC